MIMKRLLLILTLLLTGFATWAQTPGATPVKVSHEKQMMNGRKYYVHIVERGQTVYSIARAYRVESYDAVTHVDIHFLHPGDTVWLPFRGQFAEVEEQSTPTPAPTPTPTPTPVPAPKPTPVDTVHVHDTAYIHVHDTTIVTDTKTLTEYVPVHDTTIVYVHDTTIVTETVTLTVHDTTFVIDTVNYASASAAASLAFASTSAVAMTEYVPASQSASSSASPTTAPQQQEGKALKIALMMPLHLDQIDEISTSKFDVEQRGKKSYKQFEFIEFYEGILLALEQLAKQGIVVELNVVDVSENSPNAVERAFNSHHVAQSDMLVALLFRDCFDRAAQLAQQSGLYIINPMATRSDICAENPYVVKMQPSLAGQIHLMLKNMKVERPDAHLYIIHSGSEADRAVREELKRQLDERGDIQYTLFNWNQNAKLASTLKATPNCNVVSIYTQKEDQMRFHVSTLLNRLSAFKQNSPTLYTLTDWSREYSDIDFSQLQQLNYHTYCTSWDMTNQTHVDFLQAFRNRFATEPTTQLATIGYDLMLYLANGLAHKGTAFWQQPVAAPAGMLQPVHLVRSGAGLENDRAQLYRLQELKFVPAAVK